MKKKTVTGVTIEISLPEPFNWGFPLAGKDMEKAERWANDVIRMIRRRIDELSDAGMIVRMETQAVCSFCGDPWTEASPDYNGGCCEADIANDPHPEVQP